MAMLLVNMSWLVTVGAAMRQGLTINGCAVVLDGRQYEGRAAGGWLVWPG